MFSKFQITLITLISLIAMVCAPLVGATFPNQEEDDSADDTPAIVIEGPVQSINVNVIVIADINITLDISDPILTTIQVGDVVQVEGDVDVTAEVLVVTAISIEITNTNIITPVITLTGPVQAINVNIVTVFNIDIQFNPNDLILAEINVGDVISVGGNIISAGGVVVIIPVQVVIVINIDVPEPEMTPEATPDVESTPEAGATPEAGDTPVTIVIEGPVQSININIITIFDIDIEVDPSDPILTEIEIGDNIRIEGNPTTRGGTIIIVAVNITIINVIIINNPGGGSGNPGLPDGCKVTKKGKIKCTKKKSKKT